MPQQLYKFYCDVCHWSETNDGKEIKLVEVPGATIQGSFLKESPDNWRKEIKPARKFKCPSCGRIVKPRKI